MNVIVAAKVIRPYVLEIIFSDGLCRQVDLEPELYGEMFELLRDPDRFAEVTVDTEIGTIVWPNGADFAPEFLRECVSISAYR
ncbi:MAG: DUF2442 domain-containing protein [Chloroflexi bacterium]|nr:DUF2442 domain-containing protein [Chloroflexota bacterium]